jgi:hypothetical protein
MPNIIIELENEIWRVRQLLPKLTGAKLAEAENLLRFAEQSKLLNKMEYMKEALAELLDFDLPGTPRI